jgi:S-adenosylmethionine decarboxylase
LSHRKGFGPHLMLDLHKCNYQKLDSLDTCFKLLDELPTQIGMTKITMPHVFPYAGLVPEDKGITGVVIIAESHISIHTFPLKRYAFIDVFSCKPFHTDFAISYCVDLFESEAPDTHLTFRGSHFPVGSVIDPSVINAVDTSIRTV